MRLVLAGTAAALLSGCPIPQAVPEIVLSPGGSLVPASRIVPEQTTPASTFIDLSRGCAEAPRVEFRAIISEFDARATPEARWFIDYDPSTSYGVIKLESPPAPADTGNPYRTLTPLVFHAVRWQDPAVPVQVVELVVSNGFAKLGDLTVALPNRSPQRDYETQVFRWLIRYVPSGGVCSLP